MQWDGVGSVRAGQHADVAIVDPNPATHALDDLRETKVIRTIVAGPTVHDTAVLKDSEAAR